MNIETKDIRQEKRQIPLWKGIVGTAVSSFVLLLVFVVVIVFILAKIEMEVWLTLTLAITAFVSLFTLIVSFINLFGTIEYKRQNATAEVKTSKQENQPDNTELLRKLLAEGKITIEEYDKLKK